MNAKPQFRTAQPQDILPIARMIRASTKRLGWEDTYGIAYDHESTIRTVANVVGNGITVVGPNSSAGAVLVPFPYNYRAQLAIVAFWNFAQHREMEVAHALSLACYAAGATHMNFASHFPKNTVGRFYEQMGARPVETQYFLPIESYCRLAQKE